MDGKDTNISRINEEVVVKNVKETLESLINAETQASIEEHMEQRMDIIGEIWLQSLAISIIYKCLKVDRVGEFKRTGSRTMQENIWPQRSDNSIICRGD